MSFQDAVIGDIETIAERRGLIVMQEKQFTNVGRLLIGTGPGDISVTISFQFDSGRKNMLLINGAVHGPPGPDNYYFEATETARYNEFLYRLRELVREATT